MKFEKLNENKIKITLSMNDLEDKDIDFHDFMSNSIESQDLFLDMLEEAEEKIGFKTRNCKIKIEALAMTENNFILTITKLPPNSIKKHFYIKTKCKPNVKMKINSLHPLHLIYNFNSFDDYCYFIELLVKNNLYDSYKIAKQIYVYYYKKSYYLVLNNINAKYEKSSYFFNIITEYATYILNPDLYIYKLNESSTLFIKTNALKKSLSHFSNLSTK